MDKNPLRRTISFYKSHLIGDVFILVLSLIGGLLGSQFDLINLKLILDPSVVFFIYTLICLILSFPIILIVNSISILKRNQVKNRKVQFDISKLRLADGMVRDPTWVEYKEHSLTLINETGSDLSDCYVMLDELSWNNFDKQWEVVSGDVYDRPFKWNRTINTDGKISIDHRDRAAFSIIAHDQYSIFNANKKRNEVTTKFYFVFFDDVYNEIGYGSDIRLRISIRGKDQNGDYFDPVYYLLDIHLKRQHGIPKVDVVNMERLK